MPIEETDRPVWRSALCSALLGTPRRDGDVVGRAKFDAWLARNGQTRDAAMSEYVALVTQLKAADST